MAKYNIAAKIIILATLCPSQETFVSSFVPQQSVVSRVPPSTLTSGLLRQSSSSRSRSTKGQRNASISAATNDGNVNNSSSMGGGGGGGGGGATASLGEKVRTLTIGYMDSLQEDDNEDDTDAEFTSSSSKQRRRRVVLDMSSGDPTFTYDVNLPISGLTMATELSNKIGVSVRQVDEESGQLSETCLDLDLLRYVSSEEEMIRTKGIECSEGEAGPIGSIQRLDTGASATDAMKGVVVSSVVRGSLAWESGVRAGDILSATSATLGDQIWAKSTMEGVRSAITSRKVISSSMKFEFQRSNLKIDESEVVQEFELTLSRPMGIHIEDTKEGYVKISGFTNDAPSFVTDSLKVGDRIVAVDSSLGSKMWPVSNVEGVVSACTSRIPGQAVQLRFERLVDDKDLSTVESMSRIENVPSNVAPATSVTKLAPSLLGSSVQTDTDTGLLSRCRSVLKRYLSVYDPTSEKSAGVPALVADRVLESLADASVSLDAKTLSLTMNAYIACNKPYDAIKTFEASVGFSADGSSKKVDVFIGGKEGDSRIIADSKGLNKFTVTDLIRAHAMIGNIKSVRRILAAVEGDEMTIDGVQAMSWHASVEPDTKLYNAVLSIATKSGSQEGLEIATELFDDMCKPVLFKTARPKKNLISYNTMIAAFARADMREKAFAMFREMEEEGVKPDKFTVTSLVKAVVNDDDFDTARNLLRDMKRAGIESDTVGYNYVIQALCKNKLWFEAKELVADMESRGISPDSKTYGLLMSGLLKLNKPGPCLTLFESACADQRTAGLMENVKLYTTAITAAASISDYERALELVSRMTLSGVKPNYKTLTALMGACISAGQLQYAFDVFGKIEKPDGYAKLLLIRAHCDSGDYDSALNILDDKVDCEEKLSGKQIMSSYNYMIRSSLLEKQYDSGKKAMKHLLRNGFIPSKQTLASITESLGLGPMKGKKKEILGSDEEERFSFLLFVLDSLNDRNLHCDGSFYASIMFEGARIGGLHRKIASMIAKSKSETMQDGIKISHDEKEDPLSSLHWEEILQNYSQIRDILPDKRLQPVRVRINAQNLRTVLFAEQGVTFGTRRERTLSSKSKSRRRNS